MSKQKKKTMFIVCLALAFTLILTAAAAAAGGLLSLGASSVTADSWINAVVRLDSLKDEIAEDTGGYTVTVSISPAPSGIEVSEGVGSVNAVSGTYRVTSSELSGAGKLHIKILPDSSQTSDVTYSVSVEVTGNTSLETQTGSGSFTAASVVEPAEEENPDAQTDEEGKDEEQEQDTGKEEDEDAEFNGKTDPERSGKDSSQKSGRKMPSGKMPSSGGKSSGSFSGGSTSTASVTYAGSWNNYLESLSVEGHEFTQAFNKTRDTYFITIGKDETSLDITAEPDDDDADVVITGDTELSAGRSKVMISVTADNGDVRVYRIYVDKEK